MDVDSLAVLALKVLEDLATDGLPELRSEWNDFLHQDMRCVESKAPGHNMALVLSQWQLLGHTRSDTDLLLRPQRQSEAADDDQPIAQPCAATPSRKGATPSDAAEISPEASSEGECGELAAAPVPLTDFWTRLDAVDHLLEDCLIASRNAGGNLETFLPKPTSLTEEDIRDCRESS